MNDSDVTQLLQKLIANSDAQVDLLTAISSKLDDLNLGIAAVADGVMD